MIAQINIDPKIKTIETPICSFINSSTWKKAKLYAGYDTKGNPILYLQKNKRSKEIPNIKELILDEGLKNAFTFISQCNPFIVMDAKSYRLVHSGYFGE